MMATRLQRIYRIAICGDEKAIRLALVCVLELLAANREACSTT